MSAELTVLQQDGSTGLPSADNHALLTAGQALLQRDLNFTALKTPTLSRAEVNAGTPSTTPGYLYLRYDVPGTVPQELWLHWADTDHVNWHSGQISVKKP